MTYSNENSMWGIILSRKGSKRLPKKGTKLLLNKPMIQYTFEAALDSKELSKVYLFSDDKDTLKLASKLGVSIPKFSRPESVSTDKSTSEETLKYFLEQFPNSELPRYIMLLQPTSPLRRTQDIDDAIKKYKASTAEALISITQPEKSLQWAYKRESDSSLKPISSQNLQEIFIPNGALYITSTESILSGQDITEGTLLGYEMPWYRSIDIDTIEELLIAEALLQNQAHSNPS